MQHAFLLRFQEFCVEQAEPDVQAGTATRTRVRAEQPDADSATDGHAAFPKSPAAGGTMTKTSIDRESGGQDADRTAMQMRTFSGPTPPPVAQTKTATAVRAEADDNDPRRTSLNAIPKCC